MTEQPKRILLADDETAVRLTLSVVLQRAGYAVTAVGSGPEALGCIQKQTFDLVLLDLMMPGMTGLEVAARVNADQPGTPVIILTGSGSLDELDLGIYNYIHKTASPQEVLAHVASTLARGALTERAVS